MPVPVLDLFDINGKVALVTGGASGIGAAIVEALASAGAEVVIAARDGGRGESVAAAHRDCGRLVHYLPLDLRSEESCRSLIPAAAERCGRLDILVNNAGIGVSKLPQDTTLDEWRMILDVNLTGAFLLSQAAYPEFRKSGGGKIINI